MVPTRDRPKLRDDHRAGPIKKEQQPAEGVQRAAPADSDIFEDIDLLRPDVRAKIRRFAALNSGVDDGQSLCDIYQEPSASKNTTICVLIVFTCIYTYFVYSSDIMYLYIYMYMS